MDRVGSLLQSLDGTEVLRRRIAEARGLASWPEIVGAHLAERTRALRLAGGRLFVVCHGSALRQELAYHKREILRRFREVAGPGAVARELVLLESDANLSSLVREAEAKETRAAPRPPDSPRSGHVNAEAEQAASVEDPSLAQQISASYPRFDGAAYREEMRRIAKGGGARSGDDRAQESEKDSWEKP